VSYFIEFPYNDVSAVHNSLADLVKRGHFEELKICWVPFESDRYRQDVQEGISTVAFEAVGDWLDIGRKYEWTLLGIRENNKVFFPGTHQGQASATPHAVIRVLATSPNSVQKLQTFAVGFWEGLREDVSSLANIAIFLRRPDCRLKNLDLFLHTFLLPTKELVDVFDALSTSSVDLFRLSSVCRECDGHLLMRAFQHNAVFRFYRESGSHDPGRRRALPEESCKTFILNGMFYRDDFRRTAAKLRLILSKRNDDLNVGDSDGAKRRKVEE